MKLVWLARAIASRRAQIDYIAKADVRAALEHYDRIEQQTERLLEYPELGRIGRVTGTRELVINRTPFVVIYRVRASQVEILRVLHGAQQWPRPQRKSD